MNELEATRAKLKCLEMVEGTELKWTDVVRLEGCTYYTIDFSLNHEEYEFALGVVEGKPVWKGDILYRKDSGDPVSMNTVGFLAEFFSWNPPAPKTIMVELPIEYVEWCASNLNDRDIGDLFKKALESAKCK